MGCGTSRQPPHATRLNTGESNSLVVEVASLAG
jgi:hypothetical protein